MLADRDFSPWRRVCSAVVDQHRRITMARRGRPTVKSNLTGDDRATLPRWARRHTSAEALRAKIVLACAEGNRRHAQIAADLACNPGHGGQGAYRVRR